MGLTAFAVRGWLERTVGATTSLGLMLGIGLTLAVAVLTYLIALSLLRMEEFRQFLGWMRNQLPVRPA
jgi:xanthine/uracil/vitamin C permease (AzgA family)